MLGFPSITLALIGGAHLATNDDSVAAHQHHRWGRTLAALIQPLLVELLHHLLSTLHEVVVGVVVGQLDGDFMCRRVLLQHRWVGQVGMTGGHCVVQQVPDQMHA